MVKYFGFELEYFSTTPSHSDEVGRGKRYGIDPHVTDDGSLNNFRLSRDGEAMSMYGHEMKHRQKQPIELLNEQAESFHQMCIEDRNILVTSATREANTPGYYNAGASSCGFHCHFGFPEEYENEKRTNMDLIRLYHNFSLIEPTLHKLGMRANNSYAKNVPYQELMSGRGFGWDKYHGLNIGNLPNSSRRTIEIRYAAGAIVYHLDNFKEFLNLCKDTINKSMTGERHFSYMVGKKWNTLLDTNKSTKTKIVGTNVGTLNLDCRYFGGNDPFHTISR